MSLPWTNVVAVRIFLKYWSVFASCAFKLWHLLVTLLLSFISAQPLMVSSFTVTSKVLCLPVLTVLAEICDIFSAVLPYFSLWSYTCHEDLPSNRHRQYCMRNHGFGNAGGVRRDATSLCMPPHPSGPVYMVMLCHSVLILQFWFPLFSLLGNTSHKLWVSAPFLSTQGRSLAYVMICAPTAVTGNQGLSGRSFITNVLTGTRVCWVSLLYIK